MVPGLLYQSLCTVVNGGMANVKILDFSSVFSMCEMQIIVIVGNELLTSKGLCF